MATGRAQPHFLVQARPTVVEAWAVDRLGPEPAGWQAEMRSRLRAAITSLPGSDDSYLVAAYVSEEHSLVDAESVLFDSVGLAAFSAVRARGILFERAFLSPLPSPVPLSGPAAHYQIYELTPQTGPRFWSVGRPVVSIETAEIEFPLDTTRIWAAVRKGGVRIVNRTSPPWLCVRMRVGLPVASRTTALSLLKPLLDGVVSALHAHDGTERDAVIARLAAELGASPDEVGAWLDDDRFDVLGPRAAIRPEGAGIVWNPAVERLISVDVQVSVEEGGSIAGELYEATPVAPVPPV